MLMYVNRVAADYVSLQACMIYQRRQLKMF